MAEAERHGPEGTGLVWVGQRGDDADALDGAGRLAGIVCCDRSPRLRDRAATGLPVYSLERESGVREAWAGASLATVPAEALTEVLCRAGEGGRRALVVIPYRVFPWMEEAVQAQRLPLVALAARSPRAHLHDKTVQRRLFQQWGVPAPCSVTFRPSAGDTAAVARALRFPAIVQRRTGSMGKETLRVEGPEDLARLPAAWASDGEVLVSEYVEGPVVNVTVVTSADGCRVAWASVQLVGLAAGGGEGAFLYGGNDFEAAGRLPGEALQEVVRHARWIASGMASEGFRGLFGVDFIWDGRNALALEVNARFQGSTALLTSLERGAGRRPTAAWHLDTSAGSAWGESSEGELPLPLRGAEVVVYATRDGIAADASVPPDGPLEARGFPVPGTAVTRGSTLGRVRVPGGVLNRRMDGLRPEVDEQVARLRDACLPS